MSDEKGALERVTIVAGSLALTALAAWLAFLLGAWGFNTRRYAQHQHRLEGLLRHDPRLEQVVQAFQDEGSALVAAPRDQDELRKVAAERAGRKAAEVMEKGRRWPQVRVFVAGDMVYFVFFDEKGVMRDFTLASR